MAAAYTIGHSTRAAAELIGLLRRNGVEVLIDVRRFPGSRRHPQFSREALAAALEAAGIRYRHAPELGGRRESRPASPNTGWRNASFRAYADHLASPEGRAALEALVSEAAASRVALMCAEAVPWRCHRQLIADALVARGIEVRHILSAADPAVHTLSDMAVIGPEGHVSYPAPPGAQPDLFAADTPAED